MPDQSWLDTFNVFPVQGGTVEARLEGLNVLPTQIGTVEARLDGVDIIPTQSGTHEARLEGLSIFVVWAKSEGLDRQLTGRRATGAFLVYETPITGRKKWKRRR